MEGCQSRRFREVELELRLPLAEERAGIELQPRVGLLHVPAPPPLRLLRPGPPPQGEPLQAPLVALAARTHVGAEGVAPQLLPAALGVHAAAEGRGLSRGHLQIFMDFHPKLYKNFFPYSVFPL